jgi:hypothetical protein
VPAPAPRPPGFRRRYAAITGERLGVLRGEPDGLVPYGGRPVACLGHRAFVLGERGLADREVADHFDERGAHGDLERARRAAAGRGSRGGQLVEPAANRLFVHRSSLV